MEVLLSRNAYLDPSRGLLDAKGYITALPSWVNSGIWLDANA